MPPWVQRLIDRLNQEPEPDDIVRAEIQFIRLCRLDTPDRSSAFKEAYGDIVWQIVNLEAELHSLIPGGKPVPHRERTNWREEIEAEFYADLRSLELAWAEEFNWIENLVSVVGFDPYTAYWSDLLNNSFNGFRRSLRRLIEEFADQWVRTRD